MDNAPVYAHIPVMPAEVMALLAPLRGQTVVDMTVGLGGHARLFAETIGADGRLICLDRDPEALTRAQENLASTPARHDYANCPFDQLEMALAGLGVACVDRAFMDLGVSSLQLDKPERGFSFMRDGPLDMRMDPTRGGTAANIVNTWPEARLRELFKTLGEERFSGRLAKRIVEKRSEKPIDTTAELSALAAEAVPFRGRIHPATRIFQALRMEVNDELGTLSRGLAAAGKVLSPAGRLGVLTFHSLEDRLVKKTFARWKELGLAVPVTAKAVGCGRDEAKTNRRARSAKLRVIEKV